MKPIDLRHINRRAEICDWEVTRDGWQEPCEKPSAAVVVDHDEPAFPVCAFHANRAGANNHEIVPLHIVLRSVGA